MLNAIERQTSMAEARRAFVLDALKARDSMERTGLGYEAAQVHAYLTSRAEGKRAKRPKPSPSRE